MQTSVKILVFWFTLVLALVPTLAQKGRECQSVNPPLQKTDVCYRIDTSKPVTQGLRQSNVVSGDSVYIQVIRKPVEKCTVALKTDPIPPPSPAIGTFLKTMKIAGVPAVPDTCQQIAERNPPYPIGNSKPPDAITSFDTQGKILELIISNLSAGIQTEKQKYYDDAAALKRFQNCKDSKDNDICSSKESFATAQTGLVTLLDTLLSGSIPTSTLADAQIKTLQNALNSIPETDSSNNNQPNPWFKNKANQFECYDAEVNGIKTYMTDITANRKQFSTVVEVVRGLDWPEQNPAPNSPWCKSRFVGKNV
jgi:hypothetical protein